jgi:hypothetical protein
LRNENIVSFHILNQICSVYYALIHQAMKKGKGEEREEGEEGEEGEERMKGKI